MPLESMVEEKRKVFETKKPWVKLPAPTIMYIAKIRIKHQIYKMADMTCN